MPPLEVWEKVLIAGAGGEVFLASTHGKMPCTHCHLGRDGDLTKEEAHEGMIPRPSATRTVCRDCHFTATRNVAKSLHAGLWGEKNLLARRFGVESYDDLPHGVQEGYTKECASCHTSCGDCHVNRPASVGGGLAAGHRFGSPDMTLNCTACHGSRIGEEYLGQREGYGADVHYVPGAKRCTFCHTREELHGDGTSPASRLDAPGAPRCEDCHDGVAEANGYHTTHWGDLSCQTCHSQDYKSCTSCHAGEGLAQPSAIGFKIGRNPVPEKRPYRYVTLRHIPIAEDTYRNWDGGEPLTGFSSDPTWKYSAPHNIKRWTERTLIPEGGTCGTTCHGSSDGTEGVFLRQADLDAMSPAEAGANRDLIVPDGSPVNWQGGNTP